MLAVLLAISVISLVVFIYKLMENKSSKYIIAPLVGLVFGYVVYLFAGALYIYIPNNISFTCYCNDIFIKQKIVYL